MFEPNRRSKALVLVHLRENPGGQTSVGRTSVIQPRWDEPLFGSNLGFGRTSVKRSNLGLGGTSVERSNLGFGGTSVVKPRPKRLNLGLARNLVESSHLGFAETSGSVDPRWVSRTSVVKQRFGSNLALGRTLV